MTKLQNINVVPLPRDRLETMAEWEQVEQIMQVGSVLLAGRTLWDITSSTYGEPAELLSSSVAHCAAAGIDSRWLVMDGEPEFFVIGKRLDRLLHGMPGDGGPLGPAERELYDRTALDHAHQLASEVKPGDVVFLHGELAIGMAPGLHTSGAHVVWVSHVGAELTNEHVRRALAFLRPGLDAVQRFALSRWPFVPPGIPGTSVSVIPPALDLFSEKNVGLDKVRVAAILIAAGIVQGPPGVRAVITPYFGRASTVTHRAVMEQDEPIALDDRLLVQIALWDELKDPVGVIEGFGRHIAPVVPDVRLLLGGPAPQDLRASDPAATAVYAAACAARQALEPDARRRVHLACIPAQDAAESAGIVNALQRHATIVIQKSLAEGFGLSVTEAMWKHRPVVASAVGGIQDQITDGVDGVLLDDPADLEAFGRAVVELLADPARAAELGAEAHERVLHQYLAARYFQQAAEFYRGLIQGDGHGIRR